MANRRNPVDLEDDSIPGVFLNMDNQDQEDNLIEGFELEEVQDLPEVLPDNIGDDEDSDDEDDEDFDDLPELEVIPELVLATYGAIRERVGIRVLKNLLEAAPVEETVGRPLIRVIKFALRCHRERELEDGILRLLIERDPECAKLADERGGFLLHTACECGAPLDVIEYLLELHSDSVAVPTEDGQLPLHYAVGRRNACTETIDLLLERFPGAVGCASRNKNLPLHVALNKGASVDVVMKLLDAYPESAAITSAGEELPLHIACRTNMALVIIERLVELHPEGIHAKDSEGGLALHRACCGFNSTLGAVHPLYEPILLVHLLIACDCEECGAPLDVAQFLMNKDPDGACTVDKSGRIPLHYAARNGSLELAKRLLKRFPGGIFIQDLDGKLPLHLACANGSNEALIRLLIENYPKGLQQKDKSLSLPLHYAASRRMSQANTLKFLMEQYPSAIYAADDSGRLPLHHAVETHCLERIRLFVEMDKFTVTKTANNGASPLKLACSSHRHGDIKRYLDEQQRSCLQEIRQAFDYVTDDQCGFPDLVQANIWLYAKPNLFQPTEQDLMDEIESDSDEDESEVDEDFEEDDFEEEEEEEESESEEEEEGSDSESDEDEVVVIDEESLAVWV